MRAKGHRALILSHYWMKFFQNIQNYHRRGQCFELKLKAGADNTY